MNNKPQQLRVIGGKWRGRKIHFPPIPGLRPTADRIRETLFNWLASDIQDSRCLDLFSGSGALAFEALSRGAAQVVMLDQSREVIKSLQQNCQKFGAENATIIQANLPNEFTLNEPAFNIIFLDPPFKQNLVAPCCQWLLDNNLLAPQALIYIETEKTLKDLSVPTNWQLLKEKTAGQVTYRLLRAPL